MLKNTKVLSNNGKIIKGIHLESFIYWPNVTYAQVGITTVGATPEDPLYVYMYNSNDETKFQTITTDTTSSVIASFTTSGNIYLLTYGNEDALTEIDIHTDNIDGDIKGFISNYNNLEKIIVDSDNLSANFTNYIWPKGFKHLNWDQSASISGNIGTFTNFDKLEHLQLGQYVNFTGDISYLDDLTYLYMNAYSTRPNITGDMSTFNFISNLTYFYVHYNSGFSGNVSGFTFSNDLTTFYWNNQYGSQLSGNMTNWDFSNTKITQFYYVGYSGTRTISGDLSSWVMPNTLTSFTIQRTKITDISIDFSNSNLNSITMYYMTYVTSSLNDMIVPNTIANVSLYQFTNLTGNLVTWIPPNVTNTYIIANPLLTGDIISLDYLTGITYFRIYDCANLTGDVSGLTLWDDLISYDINDTGVSGNWDLSIPNSLQALNLTGTDVVIDLSSNLDFNNIVNLQLADISGFTGSFNNMQIDDVYNLILYSNTFNIDISTLNFNWNLSSITINLQSCDCNVTCDLTDWFPTGSTGSFSNVYLDSSDFTGDVSNWYFGSSWATTYGSLFLRYSDFTGDISNWLSPLPQNVYLESTSITGDIGKLDYTSTPNTYINMSNSAFYGNLSGVTLGYTFQTYNIFNNSGVTGSDDMLNYLFINRKNWTMLFSVNIASVGDTASGTLQLGDTGTYPTGAGSPQYAWDLTEAEINNLVAGNDFDGGGSNTPWTSLEKYYYQYNAKHTSSSSTKKYKINSVIYST